MEKIIDIFKLKNNILKQIVTFLIIYIIVFISVVYFSKKKENLFSFHHIYEVSCPFLEESLKFLSNKTENLIIEKLDVPSCIQNKKTIRVLYIGIKDDIKKFLNKANETELNKYIKDKNNSEILQLENILDGYEKPLSSIYLKKKDEYLKKLNEFNIYKDENYHFKILGKVDQKKINYFNFKLSIFISSILYAIYIMLTYLLQLRTLGFYIKDQK